MPSHDDTTLGRRFLISIGITFAILIAEVAGGLWTGSLALLSDAAHVFMDVFALTLSYAALRLSSLPPDDRHTFGYHRLEVLAALINGVTLGAVAVGIFSEAWSRWQDPQPIKSLEMLAIAVIGLLANLVVVFVLGGHSHEEHEHEDLNLRSAFLHVLGDLIASAGVILAALIIWQTNWTWMDPLMSVLIGLIILVSSWRVLKSSLHIFMEGVPEGLSIDELVQAMGQVDGAKEVHDLHVWSLCSGHVALSAHVVTDDNCMAENASLMLDLKRELSQYGIEHTTIQFECDTCGQGRVHPVADRAAG
jgi:cobalt-zinc-cadmium efflux system protein